MKLLSDRIKLIISENERFQGRGGQVALAKVAGTSRSVVSQWISGGIQSIDIEYALNLRNRLDYDLVWLMTGKGDPKNNHDVRINRATRMLQEMDDSQLNIAIKILDTLAEQDKKAG